MPPAARPLLLAAVLLAGSATAGAAQPAPAPAAAPAAPPTATQTVDIMNKLWGRNPGMRANHAKGVVVEGTFTPTKAGAALSTASLFKAKTIPVTLRFSDSTGLPAIADGSNGANPHGMSMRFHIGKDDEMDVVTNSLAFFPVANGEEFRDLLQALSESPPDAAHPNKVEQFIATHPAVPKAFASATTPTSFAREAYNGVDAFIFVNAKGTRQPFRFRFVPTAGVQHLSATDAAKQAPDYLVDELPKRIGKEKASFKMMAQLANPGDQTKDPSQPWPADRKMVELGTITLTKSVPDTATASKNLRFLPNRLTSGIEVSDDPLIDARVRAYLISLGRRAS